REGELRAAVGASVAGHGDADIYVSNTKTYSICTLGLPPRVSLYGGYDANWERSGTRTLLSSTCGEALGGNALAGQTISRLKIVASSAPGAGQSSYGMHLDLAGNVTLSDNEISAGAGANGAPGSTPFQARAGTGGTPGAFGACSDNVLIIGGPGGSGGVAGVAGGAGGNGGGAGQPGRPPRRRRPRP